ncbi:hypothetical protein V8C34DRAFT_309664 [Trichoderma compactum]
MVQRLRPEQLFRPRKHEYFGEPANYKMRQHSWDWKHVYINLLRIADHYGITESEFEYYLTVSSPEQDKVTDRIFYFYHILSKVQAEAIEWNWETVRRVVQCMLYTLRNECNKYAEEAGLGEDMDQFKVIYWIAGHYCKRIQRLKVQYPEWTMEDIGFRAFLDRWGLLLVPWTSHPLKSSLCKKQDHGIYMADAEKHQIVAEKILHLFELSCARSISNENEAPSAIMMAVSLLATPGFDEGGLPQSWFDFAEKFPRVAETVRAGAKAFAIPGNNTMKEEPEKGLPLFYILNPIYQGGHQLNAREQRAMARCVGPKEVVYGQIFGGVGREEHTKIYVYKGAEAAGKLDGTTFHMAPTMIEDGPLVVIKTARLVM